MRHYGNRVDRVGSGNGSPGALRRRGWQQGPRCAKVWTVSLPEEDVVEGIRFRGASPLVPHGFNVLVSPALRFRQDNVGIRMPILVHRIKHDLRAPSEATFWTLIRERELRR